MNLFHLTMSKMPAANGRFGASGAILRRKNWYNFCKEFLCRNGVETPPSPIRSDVICHPRENVAEKAEK